MTSLIILGIIAAVCYAFLTIKKRKLRNQLRVHDCIFVSEHYSIYSKQLDGGRQFVILNNAAPLLYSSSIYNSSSLDKARAFLSRLESQS